MNRTQTYDVGYGRINVFWSGASSVECGCSAGFPLTYFKETRHMSINGMLRELVFADVGHFVTVIRRNGG